MERTGIACTGIARTGAACKGVARGGGFCRGVFCGVIFDFVARDARDDGRAGARGEALAVGAGSVSVVELMKRIASSALSDAPIKNAPSPSSTRLALTYRFLGSGFAGLPATRSPGATSLVTTLEAPVSAPSPTRTGATSDVFEPILTSLPMWVSFLRTPS